MHWRISGSSRAQADIPEVTVGLSLGQMRAGARGWVESSLGEVGQCGVFRVTLELDKRLGQALRTQHWLRLATGMGGEAGHPGTQRRVCGHRPGVPLLIPPAPTCSSSSGSATT